MGGRCSGRRNVSTSSGLSSFDDHHHDYQIRSPHFDQRPYLTHYTPQHHLAPPSFNYGFRTPQHHLAPPSFNYGFRTPQPHHRRFDTRYSRIFDDYKSLDQVRAALVEAGLESSNLIIGLDFTKSNEWTGSRSFQHKSLHHLGSGQNPYEQAISIIGKSLSSFDEDNLIPCFGFGDASTRDQDVFSFYPDSRVCNGFEEVVRRYRELVPQIRLSGPTSFAPIIEMAMRIVEDSGGQYHILLIIADGQTLRSSETPKSKISPQEQKTVHAIVKASEYPLSIILVGVGDGPWDMMREFDDNIPARAFDNFQFVNFTEIMSKNVDPQRKQAEFALAALMEVPSQYKATIELNLLGCRTYKAPNRMPLPPPVHGSASSSSSFRSYRPKGAIAKLPYG
ncbi:OLC1v1028460C1 [Oldenlandia corymbosa var. corymbosa]|uniref:OLC1v1028460C1 n=1 Tax=Oldenlandia corymbosa var. corymbosa TaxID=529605 RepID=A0AAV1CEE9_OLDCO|nr:OLC1v1028460C1 [Oldenlandia corymbosa var. corymbosa]